MARGCRRDRAIAQAPRLRRGPREVQDRPRVVGHERLHDDLAHFLAETGIDRRVERGPIAAAREECVEAECVSHETVRLASHRHPAARG
jgi:hypothetical protein